MPILTCYYLELFIFNYLFELHIMSRTKNSKYIILQFCLRFNFGDVRVHLTKITQCAYIFIYFCSLQLTHLLIRNCNLDWF